jgi:hypothetical protein
MPDQYPNYNEIRSDEQYDRRSGEEKRETGPFVFAVGYGGDDEEAEASPAEAKKRVRLERAEAQIRRGEKDALGWNGLLRQEFSALAARLEHLEPDAQGNRFQARQETIALKEGPTAQMIFWYGSQGDAPKIAPGENVVALRVNDREKRVWDFADTTQAGQPRLDASASFAEMSLSAPEALETWARHVTGHRRNAQIRTAFHPA